MSIICIILGVTCVVYVDSKRVASVSLVCAFAILWICRCVCLSPRVSQSLVFMYRAWCLVWSFVLYVCIALSGQSLVYIICLGVRASVCCVLGMSLYKYFAMCYRSLSVSAIIHVSARYCSLSLYMWLHPSLPRLVPLPLNGCLYG